MTGLLDTITNAISPTLTDTVASQIGETPGNTRSALVAIVPIILSALRNRAHADPDGAASLIQNALRGGNPLESPGLLTAGAASDGGIARTLLGGGFGAVVSALASRFGLNAASLAPLLGVGGALSAGGIGKLLGANPTPAAIRSLLDDEQGAIAAGLPAGFESDLGGYGAAAGATAAGATAAGATAAGAAAYSGHSTTYADQRDEPASSGMGKWLPWLLIALAALALFFGLRSCQQEEAPETMATSAAVDNPAEPLPAPSVVIPEGAGVTSDMRDGRPMLTVYFDVGKSDVSKDLSAASATLRDYLSANPNAKLSVSGFNDPTGDAAANAALSKRRAEQVSAALQEAGVPAASISLDKPADASGTGANNAESRRVEVVVK